MDKINKYIKFQNPLSGPDKYIVRQSGIKSMRGNTWRERKQDNKCLELTISFVSWTIKTNAQGNMPSGYGIGI